MIAPNAEPMKGLSLFSIEAELLGLIDQRQDALERYAVAQNGGPEQFGAQDAIGAELDVIDGLIRDYVRAEVKKVDGIAKAVKSLRASSEAKKKEADDMYAKSKADAETANRILGFALEVLQQFDSKREEGRLFKLIRQGNGGVQPLVISQPDIVPLSFKRVTVSIRGESVGDFARQFGGQYRIVDGLHPDQKDIREALERGEHVMGARLEERGEHVRIK